MKRATGPFLLLIVLLGAACSKNSIDPIKYIEITSMGEQKTASSYDIKRYYFSKNGEIERGEQSFIFNSGRDGVITKKFSILQNSEIPEDKPYILQYDCYSNFGEKMSSLATKQRDNDLFTETLFWTQGSDNVFTSYDITYETINNKPYLKEIIEYPPREDDAPKEEREQYRAIFNYDEFANNKLTVGLYLYKKLIATERYDIQFYEDKKFQYPDPFVIQISPLKHQYEFILCGKLGTWDYYVTHFFSAIENTNYDILHSFSKGRLASATINFKHKEVSSRKGIKYLEYTFR